MSFSVGDQVAVYGYPAVVKYIGNATSHGKEPQELVGVEFTKAGLGDCDGTFRGQVFFRCRPGAGKFVQMKSVRPYVGKNF